MPLPEWAAGAAEMIADTRSLVLLEGTMREKNVLVLATLSIAETETRGELQLLALILDTALASEVVIDPEETTVYSVASLAGGEIEPV